MGRLKLQMQVTVDGFDTPKMDDDMSWDEIKDYSCDLLDTADTIVIGRKTAVDFVPYWDKLAATPDAPWHEVARRISAARKVVFSKTVDTQAGNNTVVERGDLAEAIARLKRDGSKDIIVYGGVSFVSALVAQGLVDEFHLFVNPVAAGKGQPIFATLEHPQKLRLQRSIAYDNGLVLLHYEPRRK